MRRIVEVNVSVSPAASDADPPFLTYGNINQDTQNSLGLVRG